MKDIIGILKAKYAENEPISIEDIRFALPQLTRGRIYQILDELIDKGELKRFKQGVYYIPTQTILGESLLDPRKVINQKYISDGSNYYGYYTGLSLLNAFGLTTQVANILEIRTNREATNSRTVIIGSQKVIIKRSRIEINNENYAAVMLLEIFNLLNSADIAFMDFSRVIEFIKAKNLTYEIINKYVQYMPAKAIKNLSMSGVYKALRS